jgi:tetratricopeptide (TPR) repeat protein
VYLVVVGAALAAAGAASAVAIVFREKSGPPPQPPPLELGITLAGTTEARQLLAAERAYDAGDAATAERRFAVILAHDPRSVEAAVGDAIATWPKGTVAKLRALVGEHPRSAVARLHLGFALYSDGDLPGAQAEWQRAETADPDTPAALRAEDLLHPQMPPGRPFFLPRGGPPAGIERLGPQAQLDELERRAERGGVADWLYYGSVLQRLGRPLSARAAFARAVAIDPRSVPARTADAVARFTKDSPAQAFSRLGPLAKANPHAAVVRFHLGLALLWLREVGEARRQLVAAARDGTGSIYAREAEKLLARIKTG